jgi:hypothetical protein
VSEITLRIVLEIPSEVIELLERLVDVMENEYDQKYGPYNGENDDED